MSEPTLRSLQDQEISGHSIRLHQQDPGTPREHVALEVIVGTDRFSSGMTARAVMPTRGRYGSTKAIVRARWKNPPRSTEECVRSAIMGLQAWLVEQGYEPQ